MNQLVGAPVRITATTTDANGTPTDPATLALTITRPDGTTLSRTKADYTQVSVGVWAYDLTVDSTGIWSYQQVSTNPAGEDFDEIRVVSTVDSLVKVGTYRGITGDTNSRAADILAALADAQQLAATETKRTLPLGTYTENLRVYANGVVYPSALPVATVATPAGGPFSIQGAGVWVGWWNPGPVLALPGYTGAWEPQTTLTYTGGFTSATLPYKLARAIARIAYLILHPVVLADVPAGAKSVSVGDVSITGNLAAFTAVDPSIAADLHRYRRAISHGW